MSAATIRSYPEPRYPSGHLKALLAIPRNNCTSCVEPLICAGFYNSNPPGSICSCGCPWHEHQPQVATAETLASNLRWMRGICAPSNCRQYFIPDLDWSLRPPCICGKPWQSHGLPQPDSASPISRSRIQSVHTTSWPIPPTQVPPDRLPNATPRPGGPPPTFSGFTQQRGGQALSGPGLAPLSAIAQPTTSLMISANFIRQFRARSDYASVPPERRFLSSRALAPKPISASRIPASISVLRSNITNRARGEPIRGPTKALSTIFDIAFIPFPLPSVMVPISSPAPRDLKVLEPELQKGLLERLERMEFLFSIELLLNVEGPAFVQDFSAKVMDKLTAAGVTLPSKSAQHRSLELPRSNLDSSSMSSLEFRLLEVASKRAGARFLVTTAAGPYNLETLSKSPFGPRIANPLQPGRYLLFIAPSYGLPVIRRAIDPELRQILRLPSDTESVTLGASRTAHACIGIRLLNGYVNPTTPATAAAWLCLPECDDQVTELPLNVDMPSTRAAIISRVFIDPDSDDDPQQPRDRLAETIRAINDQLTPANTLSTACRPNSGHPSLNVRGRRLPQNRTAHARDHSSSPSILELSDDTPSPPPNPPNRGVLEETEFQPQLAITGGKQLIVNFNLAVQRGIWRPSESYTLRLILTASSVEAAANELAIVLLSRGASRFKLDTQEKNLMLTAETTTSTASWSGPCTMRRLLEASFSVSIRNSNRSQSAGNGVRKAVLSSLVKRFIESSDGLWSKDSQGLYTLRTTERVILPDGISQLSAASQTSKVFQARSYAAGISVLLLFLHAKLPSPITPLMLALAFLPENSRYKLITPSFLKLLFERPADQNFIKILEESHPTEPMTASLRSLMQAAGVDAHSELLVQPRDTAMHEWLIFKAAMSLFGITGVSTSAKEDGAEISAFVAGIRDQPVGEATFLGDFTPETSVHDALSMVLAIYDRKIVDPQVLVDHIEWKFMAGNNDLQAQEVVKACLISFILGEGIPPLSAFSVSLEALKLAQNDPCFRAKKLLTACTSSSYRPFNDAGNWVTIGFEAAPSDVAFSVTASSFQFHSCLGSITVFFTPVLRMLAETPELFDAFVFRNMPEVEDFSGEWWAL